jgi:hypothetical protein
MFNLEEEKVWKQKDKKVFKKNCNQVKSHTGILIYLRHKTLIKEEHLTIIKDLIIKDI